MREATEVRPIEAGNRAAWVATMRAAKAVPTHRLKCPTNAHGEGITLYARGAVDGWCHCTRKLRILALDEDLEVRDGRTYTVKRTTKGAAL